MAFERSKKGVKALQPKTVIFSVEMTSSGTAYTATNGDISLVTSVTDVGTGEFTLVLSQIGTELIGGSVLPIVASPGATKCQSGVIKAIDLTAKTVTVVLLKGDGAVVDLDASDKVYVTLIFNDSYGQ